MTSRNALGNLANRYRAVLKKCRLLNLLTMTLAAAGLLCGGYGTALAEDVVLEQKNIHFRSDKNSPDGYSKDYDGSLSITITATGSGSKKNYNEEDFRSNEGKGEYNNMEYGTAVLLWNNSRLSVADNLDITVQPADWEGGKSDIARKGIEIESGGTMTVGGNTTILVDNYRHTEEDPPTAVDEDYGLNAQQGISISGEESSLDLQGNLVITMLNGNRSMGILAEDDAALTVGGNTTITVRNAPYYTYGIANRYSDQKYALPGGWPMMRSCTSRGISTSPPRAATTPSASICRTAVGAIPSFRWTVTCPFMLRELKSMKTEVLIRSFRMRFPTTAFS